MGIKAPTKPSAKFGLLVHDVLERYYEGGPAPDKSTREGRVADSALPHYPKPHPAMRVEDSFVFEFGGLQWRGRKDLDWDPEIVRTRHFSPDLVDHVIVDHKTSRDPSAWGLTEKTLPDDEGLVIYSMSLFEEIEELEVIGAQWTYLKTQGKSAGIPVRTTIRREEARRKMLPIIQTGQEMTDVLSRDLRDANKLEPSPRACGDFGGCDYAKMGVCVLSLDEKMNSIWK